MEPDGKLASNRDGGYLHPMTHPDRRAGGGLVFEELATP